MKLTRSNKTAQLPGPVRLYVGIVMALGAIAAAVSIWTVLEQPGSNWLYLAGLVVITACFAVKVPRPTESEAGTIATCPGDCLFFATLILFGAAPAILVACIEGLTTSLSSNVKSIYKTLFNIFALAITGSLTGLTYGLMTGDNPGPLLQSGGWARLLLTVVLCALIYYIVNSVLVSGAMVASGAGKLFQVWRTNCAWASPCFLVNALTAAILVFLAGGLEPMLALAIVPLILVTAYAQRVSRMREGQSADAPGMLVSFFEDSVPRQAKTYVMAVILGGVPVLLYSLYFSAFESDLSWLYLACLVVVATCFPVRLPIVKGRICITLSDVFVFSGMLHFGPEVATLLAVIEGATFSFRGTRWPYKKFFNLAQMGLTAFAVGHLLSSFRWFFPQLSVLALVGLVAVLGGIYFLITTGLVAGAISRTGGQSVSSILKECKAWSFVPLSAAFASAVLFLQFKEPVLICLQLIFLGCK